MCSDADDNLLDLSVDSVDSLANDDSQRAKGSTTKLPALNVLPVAKAESPSKHDKPKWSTLNAAKTASAERLAILKRARAEANERAKVTAQQHKERKRAAGIADEPSIYKVVLEAFREGWVPPVPSKGEAEPLLKMSGPKTAGQLSDAAARAEARAIGERARKYTHEVQVAERNYASLKPQTAYADLTPLNAKEQRDEFLSKAREYESGMRDEPPSDPQFTYASIENTQKLVDMYGPVRSELLAEAKRIIASKADERRSVDADDETSVMLDEEETVEFVWRYLEEHAVDDYTKRH